RDLLASSPENGEWEYRLGQCHLALADYRKAVERFESALKHSSSFPQVPRRIACHAALAGLLRDQLARPERADEVMDAVVREHSRSHLAFLARARYRLEHGAPEAAAGDINTAQSLNDADPDLFLLAAE